MLFLLLDAHFDFGTSSKGETKADETKGPTCCIPFTLLTHLTLNSSNRTVSSSDDPQTSIPCESEYCRGCRREASTCSSQPKHQYPSRRHFHAIDHCGGVERTGVVARSRLFKWLGQSARQMAIRFSFSPHARPVLNQWYGQTLCPLLSSEPTPSHY